MADIPGLIEGASEGQGLGHEFLRHIERTRLLIHVIDISGSEGRDPFEDFLRINHELERYNEALSRRPQVVALNKMDLEGAAENAARFREQFADWLEQRGKRARCRTRERAWLYFLKFPPRICCRGRGSLPRIAACIRIKCLPLKALRRKESGIVYRAGESEEPFYCPCGGRRLYCRGPLDQKPDRIRESQRL